MSRNLIECFSSVTDPRITNRSKHKLIDIIVIAVCGTICNCDTFIDIEEYGKTKIEWFKLFLDLPGGIPSHDTFCRVFALVNPNEMQKAFQTWADEMRKLLNLNDEIINIDGKYLYSTKGAINAGTTGEKTFFGMVNAFSSSAGLAIAQLRTDYEKKNEVEATRELIERLNLKGCTVTMDAMSSQPETTMAIRKQGGDYSIALKKNQRKLYEKVEKLLDIKSTNKNFFETQESGHGREETRTCTKKKLSKKFLLELEDYYSKLKRPTWQDLKAVFKVESTRIIRGKKSIETRYYLTSRDLGAEQLLNLSRSHWHVENKLHYILDVSFNEDASRLRTGFAGENLATIRQLCLNLIKQEQTLKKSVKTKRLKCGWDNNFLGKVILGKGVNNMEI